MNSHRERILDRFTRKAIPFAIAPSIRSQESLDRIVRLSGAGPSDLVLDVACGPGLLVWAFAKVVVHATGIDITQAMLEQARREQQRQAIANVTWQCGDVLPLPYADESFSIVTASLRIPPFSGPARCAAGNAARLSGARSRRRDTDRMSNVQRFPGRRSNGFGGSPARWTIYFGFPVALIAARK